VGDRGVAVVQSISFLGPVSVSEAGFDRGGAEARDYRDDFWNGVSVGNSDISIRWRYLAKVRMIEKNYPDSMVTYCLG